MIKFKRPIFMNIFLLQSRAGYVENKTKDTPAKDVEEITYIPKPCTFDMDVMNVMGIVENRKPTRTYWY